MTYECKGSWDGMVFWTNGCRCPACRLWGECHEEPPPHDIEAGEAVVDFKTKEDR